MWLSQSAVKKWLKINVGISNHKIVEKLYILIIWCFNGPIFLLRGEMSKEEKGIVWFVEPQCKRSHDGVVPLQEKNTLMSLVSWLSCYAGWSRLSLDLPRVASFHQLGKSACWRPNGRSKWTIVLNVLFVNSLHCPQNVIPLCRLLLSLCM